MHYLLKTEPGTYSFADLAREGLTVWDGVTNPVALRNLRNMKPGDALLIYHTGEEKRVAGTAEVVSVDAAANPPVVKIKPGKALPKGPTLAEIKGEKLFAESPLVRQGRLSVVPLTAEQYQWISSR